MTVVTFVCVCHIACTYCTVYGSHDCVCMLIRQIGVDAMRGERCGLDWGTKAHLMPVCINAVWHLSARDTHTLHDVLRYCDIVCEWVCVEITAPEAKLTAYKLIPTPTPTPTPLLRHLHVLFNFWSWLPKSEETLSPFFSSSFLPFGPPTPSLKVGVSEQPVLVTSWMPSRMF